MDMSNSHYDTVEAALSYLNQHQSRQPSLDELAQNAGLSPTHFQRVFSEWAGVSPKRFLQYLNRNHARKLLAQGESSLDTSLASHLSGPGRLHDLCVSIDAMSPGEIKSGADAVDIHYDFHQSPFGTCLLAQTARGVCHLSFLHSAYDRDTALNQLAVEWPRARLQHAPQKTAATHRQIFDSVGGRSPFKLNIKGSNFQLKVWEALLSVPEGAIISYGGLATAIGSAGASRAVGSALASNPVGLLIPCHRVIRAMGEFGQYRWGLARKQAMLAWEQAQRESGTQTLAS